MLKAICTAALLVALATPVAAQMRTCADRERIISRLAGMFGESRQAIGLAPNNVVVEFWASRDTGTWTITVTTPQGMTCLVASGRAFELTGGEQEPTGDPL